MMRTGYLGHGPCAKARAREHGLAVDSCQLAQVFLSASALLAWECAHRNPLTSAIESVREARANELFQQLSAAGFPLQGGAAELSALLSAAINYLALRSRSIKVFSGLPLGDDAAWEQLEKIFMLAFRGVFSAA